MLPSSCRCSVQFTAYSALTDVSRCAVKISSWGLCQAHMEHTSTQRLHTDVYCKNNAWLHTGLTRYSPLLHKHLCLICRNRTFFCNIVQYISLNSADCACDVVNIRPLNANKLRQQQEKVRKTWHALIALRQEWSQCESTQPKASRWLPPSHTSSVVTLDLLGLQWEAVWDWERWVYVHHHWRALILECYTFVSLDAGLDSSNECALQHTIRTFREFFFSFFF